MATLSDTTKKVRKYFVYFLIFAFAVILFQQVYKLINPAEEGPNARANAYASIDSKFGKIEYPAIPSLALTNDSQPVFSTSGTFGPSPNSINIYVREEPRETLGSTDYGINIAKSLGITIPYTVEGSDFKWKTTDKKNLTYNKISRAFEFSNLGINIQTLRKEKPDFIDVTNLDAAMGRAIGKILPNQQFTSTSPRTYLVTDGTEFTKTNVAENADFIRQDMFLAKEVVSLKEGQQSTNDISALTGKVYFEDPDEGHSIIVIANKDYEERERDFDPSNIRIFENKDIEISDNKGVYKLKTIETAWEEVSDGKGSLRKLTPQGETKIGGYTPLNVVRFTTRVELTELGFYATHEHSGYIYPIYIFRGTAQLSDGRSADFVFYVPAIAA